MKLLLAFLLVTSTAFAMGGKSKDQKHGEEFKKELNLSPEQVEKFHALKAKKGELRELKVKFRESKKAFKAAMNDPKASNDELRAKFADFVKLRDEFQQKRFDHMLEKRAILNPDQIEKFNSLRKKWHGKHKGKRW